MFSGVERSRSVSSMRSTSSPPTWRASSQLNSAVRAPPMCSAPVGEGANLTLIGSIGSAHANRRARLARGRPAEGDRTGRRARLPRDPDLQPVAAHVAPDGLPRRGRGRVSRGDGREPDRRGADPRRLPAQLRLRRSRHPREIARVSDSLAARRSRDRRGRRRAAPRLRQDRRRRRGDRARRRRDPRGARRIVPGGTARAASCTSRTPPAPAARSGARSTSSRS